MSVASRYAEMQKHVGNAYTEISRLGVDLTNVDKNIDNIADKLQEAYSQAPKVTGEGSSLSLTPTRKGGLTIIPKGACEQDTLPSEYQAVEYIESTGTQYTTLDTSKITNWANLEISVKAKFKDSSSATNMILSTNVKGSVYTVSSISLGSYGTNVGTDLNKKIFGRYGYVYKNGSGSEGIANPVNGVYDTSVIYNLKLNKDYLIVNGTQYENLGWNNDTFTNLYVGRYNSQYFNCYLYDLEIKEGNNLIFKLVPCYRKSDNVVGLYDLVNGVFHTNQGTGTFAKGNDTSIPNPDYPQDIKVVTGDNGVIVSNKNLCNSFSILNNTSIRILVNKGLAQTFNISLTPNYTTNANIVLFLNGVNKGNIYNNFSMTSGTRANVTITLPNDLYAELQKTESIQIRIYNSSATFILPTDVMVENNSTATSYVPHQEQTYTLHLGTNYLAGIGTYKDEIVGKTDDWKIKRKVKKLVLDGDTDFTKATTQEVFYKANLVTDATKIGINIMSTAFVGKSTVGSASGMAINPNNTIALTNGTDGRVYLKATQFANANALDTYLTSNNVNCYYMLETPTEETITDTQLIENLNDMYNLMGYDGQTNITISSNSANAQMIAQISALKGE